MLGFGGRERVVSEAASSPGWVLSTEVEQDPGQVNPGAPRRSKSRGGQRAQGVAEAGLRVTRTSTMW